MRILLYGLNYHPELTGIGKYMGELGEWLAMKGHDVRAVVAQPYYPEWRVYQQYSGWRYRIENVQGVKVFRCPLYVPKQPNGKKRLVHLLSFFLSSFPILLLQLFWRPQIIFVVEPPLLGAPSALLCSILSRAKTWLHVQDFEVDAAFNLGILTNKRAHNFVLNIEQWLMRKFDQVSTISVNMKELLKYKGIASSRQELFVNWVDTNEIYPIINSNLFRKEINISESDVMVLYSGNMGNKQGLEIIIEAAFKLESEKNIAFVMCGQGVAYTKLRSLAHGLTNMQWLDLQPIDKFNELLNAADIHLLPQRADAADLVMPSKLTGMMASARPIVATALPGTEIYNFVQMCGFLVPPNNGIEFAIAIKKLAQSPKLRKELGVEARKMALENFEKEMVLSHFEHCLRRLLTPRID